MDEMEVTTPAGGDKRPVMRSPSGGSRERPHSVPSINLDRCLQMLRQARSDSEQFAALLLVTKMVQAQETDASTRRKIFDAVGFTFPNRLLKSVGGPEGDIYRALGITIFSCFCTDRELVLHHHVTSKIPLFNDIIIEPPGDSEEDKATHNSMVEDCYQCLLAIGATETGRRQLIARDSVPVLCEAIIKKMFGYAQAMQIMRQLLAENGRELWNSHGDALTNLLTNMAKEFQDADDITKFVLCEDLGLLLAGRDKDSGDFRHYTWAEDVLNGLSDILGSYIGPEQRNPALELASLMLDHLGIEWAMSCNIKFVLLLVNLACVEVRMVLEDPDVKQVFLKASLMSSCYNILESAILYMSCTPNLPLDPKQIQQFIESLQGAYVGVTFFLSQVAEQPEEMWYHPLVTASVRVLGAWLAEETSALREEVYRILPFLIKLGSLSLEDTEDQSKGAAGVSSLSQGMENLDLHTQPEEEMCQPKGCMLSFLLPGLCHLTAETKPRNILVKHQVHLLLGRCLRLHLNNFLNTKAHEAEMGLRTLCGIFLNLLVLSPEQVTSDPGTTGLLNRIMEAVPQLGCPEHMVLLANFVVLCLMQARHIKDLQQTVVTKQFFSTAVEFLGRAYRVAHEGEQKRLTVSQAYSEHWDSISELWFLGMQALVSCIPQFPWLPEIFLETGLLKDVVTLLEQIPGGEFDLDTVDIYQNMVMEVAKHDGKCQQWLQQNGGLDVARALGMEELLQCLQSSEAMIPGN